jgi:uncharacterized coiled-coil DUF342 family protein
MDTAQIKAHLQGRLKQLVAQKLQLDENVNTLGDRVESAIRRAGPRPPGSIEKIEKGIAQQEYYRSTTTMPLNQEKLLLRQQDAAKNKIRLIKVMSRATKCQAIACSLLIPIPLLALAGACGG